METSCLTAHVASSFSPSLATDRRKEMFRCMIRPKIPEDEPPFSAACLANNASLSVNLCNDGVRLGKGVCVCV